ncbi:MAG: transcription elongation factor GreA [Clostridiales bacterium]|nr:transcription elongation factor GreA [Clostridiales bacterium]
MQKVYKLTKERLQELKEELNYLKTVREKEVAEQIKEARSYGDLNENSEYDEAKNEQGKLFSRIAEIENIIANSVIIEEDQISTDVVTTGCKVVVLDMADNTEKTYHLVGSQEADPYRYRISDESPFGKALLGSKIDDVVSVQAPAGILKFKVVEISK